MYAVFAAFSIPQLHQHRVLFWGILGAVVMCAAMVLGFVSVENLCSSRDREPFEPRPATCSQDKVRS
jgi:hypothetical protein